MTYIKVTLFSFLFTFYAETKSEQCIEKEALQVLKKIACKLDPLHSSCLTLDDESAGTILVAAGASAGALLATRSSDFISVRDLKNATEGLDIGSFIRKSNDFIGDENVSNSYGADGKPKSINKSIHNNFLNEVSKLKKQLNTIYKIEPNFKIKEIIEKLDNIENMGFDTRKISELAGEVNVRLNDSDLKKHISKFKNASKFKSILKNVILNGPVLTNALKGGALGFLTDIVFDSIKENACSKELRNHRYMCVKGSACEYKFHRCSKYYDFIKLDIDQQLSLLNEDPSLCEYVKTAYNSIISNRPDIKNVNCSDNKIEFEMNNSSGKGNYTIYYAENNVPIKLKMKSGQKKIDKDGNQRQLDNYEVYLSSSNGAVFSYKYPSPLLPGSTKSLPESIISDYFDHDDFKSFTRSNISLNDGSIVNVITMDLLHVKEEFNSLLNICSRREEKLNDLKNSTSSK